MSDIICLGRAIEEVGGNKMAYSKLKFIIDTYVAKMKLLLNNIENVNTVTHNQKKKYARILRKMRDALDCILCDCSGQCSHNKICKREKVKEFYLKCTDEKVIFELPKFSTFYCLQKSNKNHQLLYYNLNPNNVNYDKAMKNMVCKEELINKDPLYPVWYFKKNKIVTTNYSFIIEELGGNLTYNDILDKKLLIDGCFEECDRKSVPDLGKYKFTYKCDDSELIFPSILPEEQGVIDCVYSFEDSIWEYSDKEIIISTINNTLAVLEQLSDYLELYLSDFCEKINKLVSC